MQFVFGDRMCNGSLMLSTPAVAPPQRAARPAHPVADESARSGPDSSEPSRGGASAKGRRSTAPA
jgi:hypothetical protein